MRFFSLTPPKTGHKPPVKSACAKWVEGAWLASSPDRALAAHSPYAQSSDLLAVILQPSLTTGRAALLLGQPLDTSAKHGARGRPQWVWVNEAQRAVQIRAVMVFNWRVTDLEILQAGTHRVTATWKGLSVSAEFLVTELLASSDD